MLGGVVHELAVNVDRATVLQGFDVLCAGLTSRHGQLRKLRTTPFLSGVMSGRLRP